MLKTLISTSEPNQLPVIRKYWKKPLNAYISQSQGKWPVGAGFSRFRHTPWLQPIRNHLYPAYWLSQFDSFDQTTCLNISASCQPLPSLCFWKVFTDAVMSLTRQRIFSHNFQSWEIYPRSSIFCLSMFLSASEDCHKATENAKNKKPGTSSWLSWTPHDRRGSGLQWPCPTDITCRNMILIVCPCNDAKYNPPTWNLWRISIRWWTQKRFNGSNYGGVLSELQYVTSSQCQPTMKLCLVDCSSLKNIHHVWEASHAQPDQPETADRCLRCHMIIWLAWSIQREIDRKQTLLTPSEA